MQDFGKILDESRHDYALVLELTEYPLPVSGTDVYLIEAKRMKQLLGSGAGEPCSAAEEDEAGSASPGRPAAPLPYDSLLHEPLLPVIVFGPAGFLPRAFALGCTDFICDPWDYPELRTRTLHRVPPPCITIGGRRFLLTASGLEAVVEPALEPAVEVSPESAPGRKEAPFPPVPLRTPLTFPEATILRMLIINRGRPVYREALQYSIWGERRNGSRAVDMHVAALRKKLRGLCEAADAWGGSDGSGACTARDRLENPIGSVRGIGYRLALR